MDVRKSTSTGKSTIRVNFRKNSLGRNEFAVDRESDTVETDDGIDAQLQVGSTSNGICLALNTFVNKITESINMYGFVNKIVNDSADNMIGNTLFPYVTANGKSVDPLDKFTSAYEIDLSEFFTQKAVFKHLTQAVNVKDSLGSMFLLSMTAQYDVLISDIIRAILTKFPDMMNKSEKTFTLAELKKFGTLDEAENQLIDREVESIMFGSHKSQIEWFDKRSNEKIIPLLGSLAIFGEIFERRNLCAHTNQIVSDRYINNCKNLGVASEKIAAKGDRLDVNFKYVNKASEVLLQFGIIIAQSVWRSVYKKDKDSITLADSTLLKHAKRIARSRRYKVAAALLETGYGKLSPANDLNKKEIILSLAEVLIRDDKVQKAKDLILGHDWTSCNTLMKMKSSAVIEDIDSVISLMSFAKMENCIKPTEYRDNAVFIEIIKQSKFREKFEDVYGCKFDLDQTCDLGVKDFDNTELRIGAGKTS